MHQEGRVVGVWRTKESATNTLIVADSAALVKYEKFINIFMIAILIWLCLWPNMA